MISAFYYDKGQFMPVQQDALALEAVSFQGKEAALAAVCDGIGGLSEGEFASSYVSMRVRNWFYSVFLSLVRKRCRQGKIRREAERMLYDANRYLERYGERRGIKLGTTLTMAVIYGKKYLLFHVGDSRAYLIGRKCKKLTKEDRIPGNGLCKCIGSYSWKGVYCKKGKLRKGEKLLFCSDGFWKKIGEEELLESLGRRAGLSESGLERRLQKLGQIGRERGEKDNQAAVVICRGQDKTG